LVGQVTLEVEVGLEEVEGRDPAGQGGPVLGAAVGRPGKLG